jgi:translation initiation factor IF-2
MKRLKNDVKEVANGFECGISIQNFDDVKEGDVIEGYRLVEKK